MARRKKKWMECLDYHEGLSANQVKIILGKFNLASRKFDKWMYGQTCPIVIRHNRITGKEDKIVGAYEYDLFRWIENQKTGAPLIRD